LRELEAAGLAEGLTEESVRAEIEGRDKTDSARAAAPLRQAEEAWLLDTTDLSPDEVMALIAARARESGFEPGG
ncbi:MAG: (d)CMP kinase, partial [Gracilibacteraceae bacterium]|nr:(d)CMP kinase [Gracilibacteraceae bacterium]